MTSKRRIQMTGRIITRREALLTLMGTGLLVGCASDQQTTTQTSGTTEQGTQLSAREARENLAWWQDTIVYEAYPKSFRDTKGTGTGTIAGVTQMLDYLASLGVGAIWLTPVYKSPMKDNGYDISDYYSIDPSFGTMEDMDELIAQARNRGIRIVMDLVMNHTSNENAWFTESSSSKDNPKSDWYIWRDAKQDGSAPNNWRGIFGGSAWTWNDTRQQYYLHTFADFQPDLNWECEDMRKELYKMARFWLDKGLGGFRIDAVTYIKKPSEFKDGTPDANDGLSSIHDATANTPGILDFLREFKHEVMEGSDAFTVAEANGVSSDELGDWVGENGVFDLLFEFNHTAVVGNETWYKTTADWKLTDLKAALSDSQRATAHNGWYPIYFENHDQPRSPNQFLPKAQNKLAGAKMLGTVLMTLRGTPFVYEGEELGYLNVAWDSIDDYDDVSTHNQYQMALQAGKNEQEALKIVQAQSRDNARTPMQWDSTRNAGFTTGTPWLPVHEDYETCNATVEGEDPDSVLAWYRSLVQLRKETPVLVAGDYAELFEQSEEMYAFERTYGDDKAVVLANFTEGDVQYDGSVVDGMTRAIGTHPSSTAGTLQPLEAVVYVR